MKSKEKEGALWPVGYARLVLDEVDSTNAEAARQAGSLAGPLWILARRQSSGRGRRGRAWVSAEGNLTASLVLQLHAPPEQRALRSFAAALALFDAVAELGRTEVGLSLKWPNDVLLNCGKLAGILLENHGDALVIGIGVNLISAPGTDGVEDGAVTPVSLLHETGIRATPEGFLSVLAVAYSRYETQLVRFGFAPLRKLWLARAARLGEVITARTPQTQITGVFETVDEAGQLVLSTAKGRVTLAAADVYF